MREIVASSGNVMLVKDGDDNWQPQAELVIITSEVHYHLDEDLEIKKRRRDCEAFRILVNEHSITEFIAGLEKLRFAMQSAEASVVGANERKAA